MLSFVPSAKTRHWPLASALSLCHPDFWPGIRIRTADHMGRDYDEQFIVIFFPFVGRHRLVQAWNLPKAGDAAQAALLSAGDGSRHHGRFPIFQGDAALVLAV